MFQSTQNRKSAAADAAVDIAPLIDIVFILLLFFLVTTTFQPDTGIRIDRPRSTTADIRQPAALRIVIAPSGATYIDGRAVSREQLHARVHQYSGQEPRPVIVAPDRSVPSGRLIAVMDEARLAGASDVVVATERTTQP